MTEPTKQSALSLIGLSETGPDLLDDALKGKADSPAAHPLKGFASAKEHARTEFDSMLDGDIPAPKASEPAEEPKEPEQEPEKEPERKSEGDDIPAYVHSLNEQSQIALQRYQNLENAYRQQQAQHQEVIARLNSLQQPQQPAHQDEWEGDPEVAKLRASIEQEVMQKVQQAQLPVLHQIAADRFESAIDRISKDSEHFSKYFPRDQVVQAFNNIVRQHGPQYAASINWEVEWRNAYAVRDYDRVKSELGKTSEKKAAEKSEAKEHKEAQKANLKLVPKANQQGEPAGKRNSIQDEIDALPSSAGMRGVGKVLRRNMFG